MGPKRRNKNEASLYINHEIGEPMGKEHIATQWRELVGMGIYREERRTQH